MATSRPLRLAPVWDDRFTRMVGLSALGHALVLVAVVLLVGRLGGRPLPMVAYTVELTDPSALGGRLPPGAPKADLSGGSAAPLPAAPPPKAEPAEPAKPPEPPPEPKPAAAAEEPAVPIPEKPKPPEPKPEAKPPEPPKPEVKKPEPPKPEPKKPEPPKVAATKPEPPRPPPKPA